MGLETDIPVFSTTIPKRCEVFSSLSARIRRGFGEDFFEVRAPKKQLALRLEFLEIRTGRYIPESWRTATVHSNADNPNNPNLLLFWIRRHLYNRSSTKRGKTKKTDQILKTRKRLFLKKTRRAFDEDSFKKARLHFSVWNGSNIWGSLYLKKLGWTL